MTSLRIAVAGAGLIGRTHLAALSNSEDCCPIAIADPSPDAAALASSAGVPHFTALDAMLDAIAPDGVMVATPNALHVEQAHVCLDRKLPVLFEEPVAPTVAEAMPLLAANTLSDMPLLLGHHRDYSPIMETASRLIRDGSLGRLVAVTGSAVFYKPDTCFETAPWRCEPGGGPVLINHDP